MTIGFHNERILVSRLKMNKKSTTFLFGAALSQTTNGAGITNVAGVIKFIENYADENDLRDLYDEASQTLDPKDKYQELFNFIAGLCGQDSVNEIIRRVIESNLDEQGKHRIPQAVKDFVTRVKQSDFPVDNIITTNFDTLLEEEFKNQGIPFNSFSVVADTQFHNDVNDNINIIHLHGSWDRGDSMHTTTQLQSSRERIEASLQNLISDQVVVIMGYSGWEDSFTRSLAAIVINSKSEYELLWCFFESNDAVIEKNEGELFKKLSDGISRGRIHFFKGIDCNSVFAQQSKVSVLKKRTSERDLEQKPLETVTYYDIEDRGYSLKVREKIRRKSKEILMNENTLFIRASLGFGVYDFISSLKSVDATETKCLRVDCSEVITKSQIDQQVSIDTGQPLSQLSYLLNIHKDKIYFIIFDKIRGNMNADALMYLFNLSNMLNVLGKNVFFIFTSNVDIQQFSKIQVELEALSLQDTALILHDRFGPSYFTQTQGARIYDRSEGVIDKLEQIMEYLKISSVEEVLSDDEIFNDGFHLEHIPKTTLKQIEILFNDPLKELTLRMLNILSILKNGETLTNLRQDKMGVGLRPNNTQELLRLELATTVKIDSSTVLVKINPIIKDYILNKMSQEDIANISNAYLKVTVIETKKGIKLSSINRKIYQTGYNTEEDNTCTLLRYAIEDCQQIIEINNQAGKTNEMGLRRMNKLRYLSSSYIYILKNSSRYAETISAVENLIGLIEEIDNDNIYKYYEHIASAYRIKSNYFEAKKYLDLCEGLCPEEDKQTLEKIYIERLYLLERTDMDAAISLAKDCKKNYHIKSSAYILSEVIIAENKESQLKFNALVKLEKRARKLGYITMANNILFSINKGRSSVEKIKNFDDAIKSDGSAYNVCRATIYKHQTLIDGGLFNRIKDSDIVELTNIYDYLFRQKIDILFNKCHRVLWRIAEYRQRQDIIHLIFFKGTIVWRLNSDHESEEEYGALFQDFELPKELESMP
jgi:hypothetical protein